jgi:hypothetical protein
LYFQFSITTISESSIVKNSSQFLLKAFISLDKKQAFSATHKIIGLQNFVPIKTQGFCVSITQRA